MPWPALLALVTLLCSVGIDGSSRTESSVCAVGWVVGMAGANLGKQTGDVMHPLLLRGGGSEKDVERITGTKDRDKRRNKAKRRDKKEESQLEQVVAAVDKLGPDADKGLGDGRRTKEIAEAEDAKAEHTNVECVVKDGQGEGEDPSDGPHLFFRGEWGKDFPNRERLDQLYQEARIYEEREQSPELEEESSSGDRQGNSPFEVC